MALFVDTGDITEIKKYLDMGILRGATTNPTILFKCGVMGGMKGIKKRSLEIAKLISPYPLSVEVTSNEPQEMMEQAIELSKWESNIVVKIPFHGPNGELDNLKIIHELEANQGVRINVTAMMSAQQCFLAAMAGATYVSLFGGRINNMGYNCMEEIKKTRKLIDDFNLKARIIVASTREVLNIIEWLYAGAHIVTAVPDLVKGMIVHPYTKETVKQFLSDAVKL